MTEATGTDLLRQALRNRAHHGHLGALGRDVGCGSGALEEFAHGKASLPAATLQALAQNRLQAEFDPATNLLRSSNRAEAKPLSAAYSEPLADP